MQRRTALLVLASASTAALSGCISIGRGDDGETNSSNRRTVRVSGSASTAVQPDLAQLTLGVEVSDSDVAEVRDELAERADALYAALLDAGVDDDAITTARYRIRQPRNSTRHEGEHLYDVELDDIDRVGEIIDVAVDAGANRVQSVNFTLREETRESVREEVLEEAILDARDEAEHIAAVKGESLGDAVEVNVDGPSLSPLRLSAEVFEADMAGTAIEEGDVTVSASVSIEYAFA